MSNNFLSPSMVHFNVGSSKVNITNYDIRIAITNNCQYHSATDNTKGQKSYGLQKGQDVAQAADIKVAVIKTPDKKFDDDIQKLAKAIKNTKESDPKKYIQDILFSFATNDDKPFAHISFQGYISEVFHSTNSVTNLQEVLAHIAIYDPTTFNIKK
ncbi:MAG: hypothetical protein K2X94_02470 [Amoebophilaceae bacterium]|nr:hypothetical protein [Amoebophilaceae bacterium]